jgi:hypothetical protein
MIMGDELNLHEVNDRRRPKRGRKMPSARYIELRSQLTVVIVCAVLLAAGIYQCLSIE